MKAEASRSRARQKVARLVDRAWDRVARYAARHPEEAWRAQAVGEALEAVEKRSDLLGDLAGDVLAGALAAWLKGADEAALRSLEEASAREVIDAVQRGTRALEEEAHRRQAQKEAILSLAKDLGQIGVKLLVGALLAV